MSGADRSTRAARWYRLVLFLLPPGLRRRGSSAMCEIFRDQHADATRAGGAAAAAVLWLRVLADLALLLPSAWVGALGAVPRGIPGWWAELGYTARRLLRRPRFAFGIVITLGLGIGATTAVFSVVDGVLLRPLPYDGAAALVTVGAVGGPAGPDAETGLQSLGRTSFPDYLDLRERVRSFAELGAIEARGFMLSDGGDGPEMLPSANVSPEVIDILGLAPTIGRSFLPHDHEADAELVVLLSYGAWRGRFGGDPEVIGQPLERSYLPATIVGVLSPDFRPPEALFPADSSPDLWFPLQPASRRYERRGDGRLLLLGRLAPGATVASARAETGALGQELAAAYPESNVRPDGSPVPFGVNGLHGQTVGRHAGVLTLFLGGSLLLLLLTLLNAATLFLARALERSRELGVRMALGSSRGRVLRLLLTEAGVLALAGGALGVALANGGVAAFLRYAPASIPRLDAVSVDSRVLYVAIGLSIGTGLLAALPPALQLARRGPWSRLQRGAGSAPEGRVRQLLVAGQVAVALVLLSGAALLLSSLLQLQALDPGFDPDGLIALQVDVEGFARSSPDRFTSVWAAWDLALEEVAAVPGVASVAGVTNVPFQPTSWAPGIRLPGDPPGSWRQGFAGYAVTPEALQGMGTEILQGRSIERLDGPEAERVAIVNETFVRTLLQGVEPLDAPFSLEASGEVRTVRIIGVAEDVVQARPEDGIRPAIYLPYTQQAWPALYALVRTTRSPESIGPELRRAVARFNPIVPVRDLRTMDARIADTRSSPRFHAMLIGVFGLVAAVLAATGLYGTLAHSMSRRRREIGIRMALGQSRARLLRMVLADGLRIALLGMAVGLVATLLGGRFLAGFLYRTPPHDPITLLTVAAVLLAVSAVACLRPALRASRVDPAFVLQEE